jgi:hypothetical protein
VLVFDDLGEVSELVRQHSTATNFLEQRGLVDHH